MVRSVLATLPLALLAASPAGAVELAPNEKDYAIHEFFIPAAKRVSPYINFDSAYAWGECQISEIEASLDSEDSVREAVGDIPRYMAWAADQGKKPDSRHATAVEQAYEACQEYAQSDYADGVQKLDPDVKDASIQEIVLPAIKEAAPHMTQEEMLAWAECQTGVLERMLDSASEVQSAMTELPLYIEWSNGQIAEKPEFQHGNAVMNAYMQCVE